MQRRTLIRSGAALLAAAALPASIRQARADADPPAPAAGASVGDRMQIEVRRSSDKTYPVFTVEARLTANVPMRRAWHVLTDYDRLADFVPDLTSSRLIARDGHECIVAQEGFGQFLFIKQPIHLLVRILETPFSTLATTLVKGNMHEYSADWALSEIDANTTQINYDATIAPMFYVPSLFGAALMKRDLRAMLAAVVREMESGK
ncbi:polyketide cyclase [Oxalobacteraceae bacterium CAVE-383]|nr:polyketide cyclase [Oxalobacteraceae bacterium CAVE-383]